MFWVGEGGKEVPAHENPVQAGASLVLNTHPGHLFIARNHDKSIRKEVRVEVEYGEAQHFDLGEL